MAKKKKLNMGLVLVLAFLLVLGVGVGLAAKFLSGRKAVNWEEALAQADDYFAKAEDPDERNRGSNYGEAIKAYGEAIKAYKKSEEKTPADMMVKQAQACFGSCLNNPKLTALQRRDYLRLAYKNLTTVLQVEPDNIEALKLSLEMRWIDVYRGGTIGYTPNYREFVELSNRLIALEPSAEAYFQRGTAYRRQILRDRTLAPLAEADFLKAIELEPDNSLWRTEGLISFLESEERTDEADAAYLQAIEENPEDTNLLRSYAATLFNRGMRGPADSEESRAFRNRGLDYVDRAIQINDQEIESYVLRAEMLIRMGDVTQAKASYQDARLAMAGNILPYLKQATLHLMEREHDQAVKVLEEGKAMLEERIASGEVTNPNVLKQLERQRIQVIEELASALLDKIAMSRRTPVVDPEAAEASDVLVMTLEQVDDTRALVLTYLDEIEKIRDDGDERSPAYYTILGRLALLDEDEVMAEQHFLKAREVNPNLDEVAMRQLIFIYFKQRRLSEAEEILDQFLAHPFYANDARIQLSKAQLLIAYRDYEGAQTHINFVLERDPNNKDAQAMQSRLDIELQQTRPSNIVPGTELDPLTVINLQQQVERIWLAGRTADAVTEMQALHNLAPDNLNVIRRLAQMYMFLGRKEEATDLYRKAKEIYPDNQRIDLQLRLLQTTSREEQLAIQEEYAESLDNELDRAIGLARVAELRGDKEGALARWHDAAAIDPLVGRSLENLFILALDMENWEEVEWAIGKARESDMDPEIYESQLAMTKENYVEAAAMLEALIEREPDNRRARMLLGRVHFEMEDYTTAESIFLTLIQEDRSFFEPVAAMIHLSMAQDDLPKWKTWVHRAYELNPSDMFIRNQWLRLQETDEATMDPEELIEARLQILDNNPLDTENIYRLGRLYEMVGEEPKAEQMFQTLYNSMDDKAVSGAVLLGFYDRTNQMDKVQAVVQDMLKELDDKASAYLLWGQILGRRNYKQGLAAFDEAIKLAPTDIVPYDAKAALQSRSGQWADAAQTMADCMAVLEAEEELRPDLIQGAAKLRTRYLIEAGDLVPAQALVDEMLAADPMDHEAIALQGVLEAHKGNNAQALDYFDEALKISPNYKTAMVERGRIYLTKGDFFNARTDFERARELAGLDSQIGVQLAIAYKQMGSLTEAEQMYTEVIENDPMFEPAMRGLLEIYFTNRDWTRFKNLLLDAQRRFSDPYYYLIEAEMYRSQNDAVKMLDAMERGVDLYPASEEMIRIYLQGLVFAGRRDDALVMAEKYLDHARFGPPAKAVSGRIHIDRGNVEQADALLVDALSTASQDQLAFVLQQIAEGYGREKAIEKLDGWLQHRPDDWQLLVVVSAMVRRIGDDEAALGYLERAEAVAEDDAALASVHFQFGQTYYRLQQWQNSADAYAKALEYAPDSPLIMNDLAYVYADKLDQPELAEPYALEAVRLLPTNPQVIDTIGWVMYKLKRYQDAGRYFTRSINIAPSAVARYHLGLTYEALQENTNAIRQYEQAREMINPMSEQGLAEQIDEALKRLE